MLDDVYTSATYRTIPGSSNPLSKCNDLKCIVRRLLGLSVLVLHMRVGII